ncbi:craniofacial development protein 2-like [Rhizophagus clarus]|uniref:Craniofacial development protein 2-like n=1 Tax=Rhizophagus clarus TaxID=94130 RepID=A0A8H3L7G8_9GLOM|nr:craniofacial development protein 2-like [Rhizophagus clarus]
MMNSNINDTLIIDNSSHSFDINVHSSTSHPFTNLDDKYNYLTYTSDNQSDYLKIGTINIQGAYQLKLDNIILYFTTYNFDILTLTETGFHTPYTHNNIQIVNHPNNNSKLYIIHDTNGEHKDTGVAIILLKKLFKHFITCIFLNGRLLHITLKFKPHISLNIIAAYLPANPSSIHYKDSRSIYYTKLQSIINSIISSDKSHKLILGDFNTDLDSINNKSSNDSNFKFIKLLRNFQLYDLMH